MSHVVARVLLSERVVQLRQWLDQLIHTLQILLVGLLLVLLFLVYLNQVLVNLEKLQLCRSFVPVGILALE